MSSDDDKNLPDWLDAIVKIVVFGGVGGGVLLFVFSIFYCLTSGC